MVFLGVYRAIYDYTPQSDEELEIKDGDLLFVLDKSADDDWWKAKKKAASDDDDEPEGLIPANYVEEAKPEYQAKALYDYAQQTDEELSFKEEARLDVYDTTDPDWTLVGANGEFGFAPAIYIEPASSANASAPAVADARGPSLPTRPRAAANEPIPGESDYPDPGMAPTPSPEPPSANPAAALAGIIAQRTGGDGSAPAARRQLASPPPAMPPRQYTPESEEDAPSLPQRPRSQVASPTAQQAPTQYASPRFPAESSGVLPSPPYNRAVSSSYPDDNDSSLRSPGGFHLYNVHEMVSHMGKNKKMPTTLGINIGRGLISISPEKSKDGPSNEWSAEKLTHYSIEGKHVFVELVRPSKSVDFHAGAKDTAQEIVSQLGDLAGAVRQEGLREVIAASAGTGSGGQRKGQMLCEFMAQGDDEVTVAVGDEVIVLDDQKSDDWWLVRRLKNGKKGVVPASYVEITGTMGNESISGLNAARSTVEQNRIEEQRLAREATQNDKRNGRGVSLPERGSSLSTQEQEPRRRTPEPSSSKAKTKPNTSRVRTWTDRSGTFKVEAEFIGLREGKIHLHKLNGVKIAVPVTKMAVEDLEYVEKATGISLDDDKPLSDIKRRSTQKAKDRDQRNGASSRTPAAGATVTDKDQEQWFDFFLQCGVNPQICERYASAFARDQMGQEVLPDVNEQLLRTLGLKEGDILRVMKFLDAKYGRAHKGISGAPANSTGDEDKIEPANGGLFSGPGGALRNNTRKGRPAPAVATSDTVDDSAFKPKESEGARATPLANAPRRQPTSGGGFDDDAWDVKPGKGEYTAPEGPPPGVVQPPRSVLNDDLSLLALPLQPQPTAATPTPAAPAGPAQPEAPAHSTQPQGAEQAIFDKIAALKPQPTAPPRQRPPPPITQPNGSSLGVPPPPRAASAPGFPPQQSQFGPPPLQPQLTGYQQPMQTGYQQQLPPGYGQQQGMQQGFQPMQGFAPQQTGFQYPQQTNGMPMMSQPTGMNFQQQGLMNGAATGSPFADPPRQPYQSATPSGLAQSFGPPQQGNLQQMQQNYPALAPQPTGFQPQSQFGQSQMLPPQQTGFPQQQQQQQQQMSFPQQQQPQQQSFQPMQQQPSFNISQPTGLSANTGFGQAPPQLPPQQTGGVLGPMQPLVPQKTGPAPPVRFGVGAAPMVPQRTGRADLGRATPQNPFGF
ncbi:cytoskeletal protein binding protein [Oleoguttula sp. CCFEE 5521]